MTHMTHRSPRQQDWHDSVLREERATPPRVGGPSPWDRIQTVDLILPGIVQVTTAGHGGWWLSPDRALQVPAKWRVWSDRWAAPQWFEEDCCWAAAAMTFDAELAALDGELGDWWRTAGRTSATAIMGHYFPETRQTENEVTA